MESIGSTVGLLHLFGDATRVRLAALLARHALTVADLTAILGLPQSRVSTHLGKLKEAGVLRDRRDGASTVYALNEDAMPEGAQRVWSLLEQELGDPILEGDRARCEAVLAARDRSAAWPDSVAGQMERHYSPGRTWEATARAFLGLMALGDVLDAGAGDGVVAQLVASRARTVTCLDRSDRLLQAARRRLADVPNVRFVRGDMHAVPLADADVDQVLLMNVLTYADDPCRVIGEAARVLRPGGMLALVTLDAHRHAAVTARYGHVHAGFSPATLRGWLEKAGLLVSRCEVTSREPREPHFEVVTAFATKAA